MSFIMATKRPRIAASGDAVTLHLYRPNVGVVLFNAEGLVWLGRRAGASGPTIWQFPQGGVDKGEDLLVAARRELQEETGVVSADLLARIPGWITYDFPPGFQGSKVAKGWRGQRQAWFAMRFTGAESEIDLEAHPPIEFDQWRWAHLDEALDTIVDFKRDAYAKVVQAFRAYAA
jgi:putative (di)nucleoside polyphosphate hydrolase